MITQKIRPLIQDQPIGIKVKRNQLKQLDQVMQKLEDAIAKRGPLADKSCSDLESWEPPSDKLRAILAEDHDLKEWLSKTGPIVAYAEYYIGECKNYTWDKRVYNIYKKTLKNQGTLGKMRF